MLYLLIAVGLIGIMTGVMNVLNPIAALWIPTGAVILAIGLATCDIVAAIRSNSSRHDCSERHEQFQDKARIGDSQLMARMLVDRGIPGDLAQSTANSICKTKVLPSDDS